MFEMITGRRYQKISLLAMVIAILIFCGFIFVFEKLSQNRAQTRIDDHAKIIADDLWNYNYRGSLEYLKLASLSQHYESLVVTDHSGKVFHRIEMESIDPWDKLLMKIRLMRRIKLLAQIEHEGNIIGWIETVWLPQTLYVHAYVFFALILVVTVIHLYARLLEQKHLLEVRVQERTAELLRSNLSLKKEVGERSRVAEALRKSEEKQRVLAESISDVIWTANMDLQFNYVSPVARKMHRWKKDELPPYKTFSDIIAPSSVDIAMKTFKDLLLSGERTGNYSRPVTLEIEMNRVDGSTLWTEVTASFIVNEYNQPEGILGVTRDITDRRKAQLEKEELQQKLDRSKKMESIGLLAGGVAHDLNNVLSGIVSYPDLIMMDLPEDSPLRAPVQTIKDSGQKAANIVMDLLTLARRGVVATEILSLNNMIENYLASPEHKKILSYHRKTRIQTRLESHLPNMKGSSTHLRKSIMNLISNAAEAQPKGGSIMISTESRYLDRPMKGYETVQRGEYVVMRIEDHGEGISEEDLHRIFEPFYTKKVMGRSGTGLGMAVVWGTVQDHKGYIDIQSVVGEGTVFELYFPLTRESVSQAQETLTLAEITGQNESILVVDDMEEQREIATNLLTKLNYAVKSVASGEEAVEFLKTNEVDLVILDMIMDPGMDGLETYQEIHKLNPNQKAIIASGFSETDRVKELQRLGAGEYIKKPYVMEKIGLVVKEELGK